MKITDNIPDTPKPSKRLDWVDQVKGLTIFLVVYGHNFPVYGKHIDSFRMPLFIMVAGFFHPRVSSAMKLKKRFKTVMIPYFIWSSLLFLFWLVIGRDYGDSAKLNLSPVKNFIGIFYSQGDRQYMDWGIPLWFLPNIFMTFVLLYLIRKIENRTIQYILLATIPIIGLLYPHFTKVNLPWSLNVAMVSLLFYAFGNHFFKSISNLPLNKSIILMFLTGILNIWLLGKNSKIEMYRASYGNELYFILNGISIGIFILLLFKTFPYFRFFGFIGKFSMTILALHLTALTFIKLVLMLACGQTEFNFSEWEKFSYTIVQIVLLIPVFFIINKYLPLLNGGYKKI
ncbi:acyltransferase family protein [Flavobacterium silvaticum]|uniref:Acyltransferase family protein n=1 Tax=Flavobacterium silvaticum TaxID=1852020 RepID=A0A972FJ81_9FLAO|nr:acyltransferase family protein [Flavobacterium silvaticum]NMH26672.1 acyltransferase family protein [Flavobacterium silvaticum]